MTWTSTARHQAGLIARSQLLAANVPARTVDAWLAGGRLQRMASRGVYRVAGSADTDLTAAWFAALSTRSAISYVSAASWWEMPLTEDGLVHITRAGRRRLDWPPGVRVHRVALDRDDIVQHRGLWVTTRAVTVLDCIGWTTPGRALSFADRAIAQKWITPSDIARRLENQPGRWGNQQLRRIAAAVERGVEAESERRLHQVLRRAGVSGWSAQHPVLTPAGRFRVDVAFPQQGIAIEVDGYAYHSGDQRFQHDRTKQNALLAAGWRVLRFTWADIVDRPEHIVAQICTLLAA